MTRRPPADDLSVQELRRLLIEKRRTARQERLEHFRRTGRVIVVAPESTTPGLSSLTTQEMDDDQPEAGRQGRRKRWIDRLLLVIEAGAVIGLLFILLSGMNVVRSLNREVRAALAQPTLTPTPLIVAVVLPSGHTPPDAAGVSRPNEAEIPEELRPLVQSIESLPSPTPAPEQSIRLRIPTLEVDAPVVQGDGWEQLKKGIGQHIGTPGPGQNGNIVLSAHNDVYGELFRHLDQLEVGDTIVLYSNLREYTYVVTGSEIVLPSNVEAMAPTEGPTLTLVSCYPYLIDNKRIIVKAELQENS